MIIIIVKQVLALLNIPWKNRKITLMYIIILLFQIFTGYLFLYSIISVVWILPKQMYYDVR